MTFCGYYDRGECRSCSEIEKNPTEQIREKEIAVRDALRFLPHTESEFPLAPSVQLSLQGFRNRAKMSVTGTVENPVIGLLGSGEGAEALDLGREILECPIHNPALNALFQALPDFITRFRLIPYRIADRQGELKGLIAFHSPESGETYLRFILRSQECVSRIRKLLPELTSMFPSLTCVSANIQPVPHAVLEGKEEIILTEKEAIRNTLGGRSFQLAPRAFVQTNSEVATRLYQTAAQWIREGKIERGVELFSGQGAFSFFTAPHVKAFLGVEINADAVRTANETAKEEGFSHLLFECVDAGKGDAGLEETVRAFSPELILANPPRKGMGEGITLIEHLRPKHFFYSSCALESLAADLKRLAGYEVKRVQIFEMFPHTRHFETLVWLSSKV